MVAKRSPVVLQQPTSVKCGTSGDWDLIFPGESIKAGEKSNDFCLSRINLHLQTINTV